MNILSVRVIVEYADMRFSIFAIEYLRENEKVLETVFAFQAKKNYRKSRDTVPLRDKCLPRATKTSVSIDWMQTDLLRTTKRRWSAVSTMGSM